MSWYPAVETHMSFDREGLVLKRRDWHPKDMRSAKPCNRPIAHMISKAVLLKFCVMPCPIRFAMMNPLQFLNWVRLLSIGSAFGATRTSKCRNR